MLAIHKAEYIADYKIHLFFNDGKEGIANLEKAIWNDKRPIFSALKDQSDFSIFKVEHGTLVWPNGLDLAPEYLFYLAFKDNNDYREQFERWGYME
uniref:DUF2442 domain-containing protein n=1 Tax=Candidatus Kentrum sp. MB TaxID=2138164 RepID=A0A451BAS2_9GAMM|nr:MAG: Protein of unknown function (DUF2442) [Candidatus Kentron sp. MB]VFK31204.1 MAG: Protein of unknown function (DUF2442) [Candidatus Kentron sp. MB]VFK75390.1 MAG: Protein of unknown function (DUF2442) [Candidatus Kentron sp. MB]